MKIRKKIILYFSVTIVLVTGVMLWFIYQLFSSYRQQEFLQRLEDKISFSLKFLDEVQQVNLSLLNDLDRITINDLYEEKMLLFDANKKLIYASLDDTKIFNVGFLLKKLTPQHDEVTLKEGNFDVVGNYFELNGKGFYGLYKAYDTSGYTQLHYLGYVLWFAFALVTMITLVITVYLSKEISSSINRMAKEIGHLQFDSELGSITVPDTKDEINFLALRFNEMMTRLQASFSFQKHAVHHISHELKTPIAVLVSNFEKMETEEDPAALKRMIGWQKEHTMHLSETINALLEISKIETGHKSVNEAVRIDDLLLDILEDLKELHKDFDFQLSLAEAFSGESELTVFGNKRLLKAAFLNLAVNAVYFNEEKKVTIALDIVGDRLQIMFVNQGKPIREDERRFLFQHFFRGQNSQGRRGFGLGLVMVHRIVLLYHGSITYDNPSPSTNIFKVQLPHANNMGI